MSAPAVITDRPALRVNLRVLDDVILALEDGAPAGRALDADVMTALGWRVIRPSATGNRTAWLMQSPLSTQRQVLPRVSRDAGATRALRIPGWDYSSGERGGRGTAWCGNGAPPVEGAGALWFEANAATEALALLRVWLHAYRALMRAHLWPSPAAPAEAVPALAAPLMQCVRQCGWEGPEPALLHGRCPDCGAGALRAEAA